METVILEIFVAILGFATLVVVLFIDAGLSVFLDEFEVGLEDVGDHCHNFLGLFREGQKSIQAEYSSGSFIVFIVFAFVSYDLSEQSVK